MCGQQCVLGILLTLGFDIINSLLIASTRVLATDKVQKYVGSCAPCGDVVQYRHILCHASAFFPVNGISVGMF